jgi:biopolymer transport protein ExbD
MRKKTFFIIAGILIVLASPVIFFILTTSMASPEPVTIIAPKTDASLNYQDPTNKNVQVIIFSSEKIFCYADNINNGKTYSIKPKNSFREYLASVKKLYGDKLVIVLKTTKESTYQSTVDVLDEMTINNIKQFVLVDLNKEEQEKLDEESSGTHPDPEAVTIEEIDTTKKHQQE